MARRSKDPNVPPERWRESRNATKARLIREGRWEAYKARREELRKTMPMHEAHQQAALEFPPLPEGMVANPAAPTNPPSATSTPTRSPSATTTASTSDGFEADYTDEDLKQDSKPEQKRERVTERDIIRWVSENIRNEGKTIHDAPNGAAYALYFACRRDPDMERSFWTQMWTKLLPSQAEMDEARKYEDPATHVLSAIEAIALYNSISEQHRQPPASSTAPDTPPAPTPGPNLERSPLHQHSTIIIRPTHEAGARPQPRTSEGAW